jgi:uncharacterized protein YgbK (DUF1537 family)
MRRILVIADDLSGAAEITGIGARHGLPVRLERDVPVAAHDGLTVLDTDTRLVPQDEAPERVRRAVRHLRGGDFDLIYKKTDSVFRGPILAELDALMDVFGRPQRHSDRAEPVARAARSAPASTPSKAFRSSTRPSPAIRTIPRERTGRSTCSASRLIAHRGRGIARSDARAGCHDRRSVGCDDVRRWAEGLKADPALPAGGADFFNAILEARGLPSSRPYLDALPPGRTLFVCGTSPAFSGHVVSRAQAERITVCPMPDHSVGAVAALEAWHSAARQALDTSGRTMIVIQKPLDRSPGVSQRFQAALAEVVGRLLATAGSGGTVGADNLLLEGGATASAVCRRNELAPVRRRRRVRARGGADARARRRRQHRASRRHQARQLHVADAVWRPTAPA